jgi:hypothetical protein
MSRSRFPSSISAVRRESRRSDLCDTEEKDATSSGENSAAGGRVVGHNNLESPVEGL